jgi:hypothetical protein
MWLVAAHPVAALVLVLVLIALAVAIVWKFSRLVRHLLRRRESTHQ